MKRFHSPVDSVDGEMEVIELLSTFQQYPVLNLLVTQIGM